MKFAEIPGLLEIKKRLIRSVEDNKISHAQLFQGKEGALNLPMALAYTAFLHCENKMPEDSCGQCAACKLSARHIHPDTHFAFPSNNVEKEKDIEKFRAEIHKQWRSFILESPFGPLDEWVSFYGGADKQPLISREEGREIIRSLSLKPFQSRFKVMMVWQPEFMHPSAANSILKILEEPPPHTHFLLVSNKPELLLPTILSRTQITTVPLLRDIDVEGYLNEKNLAQPGRRARIVQLAEGNLDLAIRLCQEEEDHHYETFAGWMRSCWESDFAKVISLSEEFHQADRMYQRNFLGYGIFMLRETLVGLSGADIIHRSNGQELDFVKKFSKLMNVEKINDGYRLLNDALYHLERNGSAKMIFTDLSLQLNRLIRA